MMPLMPSMCYLHEKARGQSLADIGIVVIVIERPGDEVEAKSFHDLLKLRAYVICLLE